MQDGYDQSVVDRIVDEAMGGTTAMRAPQPHSISKIPFGIYDTELLQRLSTLLGQTSLHQGDIQMILDDLRDTLLVNINNGSLVDLHSLTLNCKRCLTLKDAQLPLGNLSDPDVVFVSDRPESAWPEKLLELLDQADISIDRVALTFVVRCSSITKRLPSSTEVGNCSNYLYTELQLLSPKLIVPMGSSATSAFIDPLKISEEHGTIFWIGPWAMMPVYGLGYLYQKDYAEKELLADLHKIKTFLYGNSI